MTPTETSCLVAMYRERTYLIRMDGGAYWRISQHRYYSANSIRSLEIKGYLVIQKNVVPHTAALTDPGKEIAAALAKGKLNVQQKYATTG